MAKPSFLISVLLLPLVTASLHPALQNLNAAWPVPSVSPHDVSSTFGPRIKISSSSYDFHRGIDISALIGTPVIAALPATFYKIKTYSNGGLTVILDHSVSIPFHGATRTRLTTFYMHLDAVSPLIQSAHRGMPVSKGTVIGYAGMSGSAVSPHLHFEARLGSRCSLEYQLAHPTSSCNVGFDPHVHPLGLYSSPPTQAQKLKLIILQFLSGSHDGLVRVQAPDDFALASRYRLTFERNGAAHFVEGDLNLNTRLGFDASTTANLDTPDTTKPHLEPVPFGVSASSWEMKYRIPAGFSYKDAGKIVKLCVMDVFDEQTCINVADVSGQW